MPGVVCLEFGVRQEIPVTEQHPDGPGGAGLIGVSLAGRFRVDRLIGTGGMAAVYAATDLALGRTVAVKLFRLDTGDGTGAGDASSPQRRSGEVSLLAGLNHFALVTLFDAGTTVIDGVHRPFIVMEFVDGTDLRSRIAAGLIPGPEVAAMGADLAEALHYVHGQGIIHRDIKPANVLLTPSGFPGRPVRAKLADFGIARLVDATRLTATGSVLGTAGYLSPEQALGASIGPPSDVYSLGLVLLECLTGERAFPGTAVESAMARLQRDPLVPAGLGPEWAAVLTGMTAREPTERLSPADAAVRLRRLAHAGAVAGAVPAGAGGTVGTVGAGGTVGDSSSDAGPGGTPGAPSARSASGASSAAGAAGDSADGAPAPTIRFSSEPTAAPTRLLPLGAGGAETVAFSAAPVPAADAAASALPRSHRGMIAWLAGAAAVAVILVAALTLRPETPAPALTPSASAVPTVSSSPKPASATPSPTPSVDTKPGKGNGKTDTCKKKDDCSD
jgi:eukaryotic-like serine/threonine-protein kinase